MCAVIKASKKTWDILRERKSTCNSTTALLTNQIQKLKHPNAAANAFNTLYCG